MNFNCVLIALLFLCPLAYGSDNSKKEKTPASVQVDPDVDSQWGGAVGTGWIHDYPGAAQGRTRFLVMPVFKGKYLTVDRQDGVKSNIINRGNFEFSISFSFLFPTESNDIPIRAGMPDLDWTLQIGPEAVFYITRTQSHTMLLRLPLRFVASTDFSHRFDYQGWVFAPSLRSTIPIGEKYGEITTRLEIEYASEEYNDYFYEVAPQFATPERPAYDGVTGFLESIVGITYSYSDLFPWGFFISGNIYLLGESANKESPLHLRSTNHSVFGAVIYYF